MTNPLAQKVKDKKDEGDLTEPGEGGPDPVPEGTYQANIAKHEFEEFETEGGKTGHFLQLDFYIKGPDYAGRTVSERYYIDHPNSKTAEDIADDQLANLDGVLGFDERTEDPERYVGRDLIIIVSNDEYNGSIYDGVKGFQDPFENDAEGPDEDTQVDSSEDTPF